MCVNRILFLFNQQSLPIYFLGSEKLGDFPKFTQIVRYKPTFKASLSKHNIQAFLICPSPPQERAPEVQNHHQLLPR